MRLVRVMYCQCLVSPGIGATLQTLFFIKALIMELLPTLGYPINPTLMHFFSLCKLSNCFNNWIKDPLPNGLV
jgi:hypothetical protein